MTTCHDFITAFVYVFGLNRYKNRFFILFLNQNLNLPVTIDQTNTCQVLKAYQWDSFNITIMKAPLEPSLALTLFITEFRRQRRSQPISRFKVLAAVSNVFWFQVQLVVSCQL